MKRQLRFEAAFHIGLQLKRGLSGPALGRKVWHVGGQVQRQSRATQP